jgi:hypothetical protein
MRAIWAGLVGLCWAGAAAAADLALIVGNEDYRRLPDIRAADDVIAPGGSLERQGFTVIAVRNGDAAAMAAGLSRFVAEAGGADRVVVILNGHFLHSRTDAWLLPVDAPEAPGLAALPRIGLPLSVLAPVLEAHPGRAVLVLGEGGRGGAAGDYLTHGSGIGALPQGVTGFTGDAAAMSWFVSTSLIRPGLKLADAAQRLSGVTGLGYLPADYTFLPAAGAPSQYTIPHRRGGAVSYNGNDSSRNAAPPAIVEISNAPLAVPHRFLSSTSPAPAPLASLVRSSLVCVRGPTSRPDRLACRRPPRRRANQAGSRKAAIGAGPRSARGRRIPSSPHSPPGRPGVRFLSRKPSRAGRDEPVSAV